MKDWLVGTIAIFVLVVGLALFCGVFMIVFASTVTSLTNDASVAAPQIQKYLEVEATSGYWIGITAAGIVMSLILSAFGAKSFGKQLLYIFFNEGADDQA